MLSFWGLFEISAVFLENYMILDFISKLFGIKKNKMVVKLGFISTLFIMFIESFIISKFTFFDTFSIFVPIFTLFIYAYVFLKGNMFEKLFISVLIMTIIIVINSVPVLFISIVTNNSIINLIHEHDFCRLITIIITKVIFFIVTRLLLKVNINNKYCLLDKKEVCMMLFTPVVSVFFSVYMIRIYMDRPIYRNNYIIFILLLICILSLNFINYYLFLNVNNDNMSELKLAVLKEEYNYHTRNLEQVKNTYDEMRKMQHDLKNNIFCMMALLEQKKYDQAMEYAVALSKKIDNTRFFANTNNEALNGIINLKLSVAQDKNIKLNCDIADQIINLDTIDLCVLIANLLDNAIEASQKIDRKYRYIEVSIKNTGESMVFVIKNRIMKSVLQTNPELLTSKNDNKFHGIGGLSVKGIVEKYNGSIIYYEKDNLFCCKAVLKDLMKSKNNGFPYNTMHRD